MKDKVLISLVDDDPDVRRSLARWFKSWGLKMESFASAREFLQSPRAESSSCLIIDLKLPGMSGLELQERLVASHLDIPIIFISAYGTVSESVCAMKTGAMEFLEKPVDERTLMEAVTQAIERHQKSHQERAERQEIERRLATLTPRERQVLTLVIQGWLNKQIAAELGTAEITVKIHRGRIMQKLNCSSLAELVLLAAKAGIIPPKSPAYTKV